MYYVIGRAPHRRAQDIRWPSMPIGTVSCSEFVLCHRTGGAQEETGHQPAVIAHRDGQLCCMCTKQGRGSRGEEDEERKRKRKEAKLEKKKKEREEREREEEENKQDVDEDLMAAMGFSGFGGSAK